MDIDLGAGPDGIQTARRMLRHRFLPIVFLSSHEEQEILGKAEAVTSYGYVSKNSSLTVLDASIKMAFRLHAANLAVREQEEKYRRLSEDTTALICTFLPDGTLTYVNSALASLAKTDADSLQGRNIFDLLGSEGRDRLTARLACLSPENPIETHEERLPPRTGDERWIQWTNRAFFDPDGVKSGYQAVGVEVTERKRTEGLLRLQGLVLDQISDRVTITDLEGRITYVNQAELKSLGYTRQDLIGASTEKYGEDPNRGATQRHILETTLRDGEWRGEVINRTIDGRDVIMDCRTCIVRDPAGQPLALCGIATDITALRNSEAARGSSRTGGSPGRG